MKNTGVIRKIDELGRIVVPKEIRKSLNIKNGEDVQIYIEEDKIILKKYQKALSIKEMAEKYLSKLGKLTTNDIIITDKEKVIVSNVKEIVDKKISNKIIGLIDNRKSEIGYSLTFDEEKIDKNYFILPIISDADAIGSIILLSNSDITNEDKLLINVLNSLLSIELY